MTFLIVAEKPSATVVHEVRARVTSLVLAIAVTAGHAGAGKETNRG